MKNPSAVFVVILLSIFTAQASAQSLRTVALTGNSAPDVPGTDFSVFGPPVLNDAGQTVFMGFLTGVGVTSSNNRGIFSEGGGSGLSLVARVGDAAPGTGGGVNFSNFFSPALSDVGQTGFFSFLTGTGVTNSNERSIWVEDLNGNLQLIAREGDPAPGTEGGVNLRSFNNPALNGAGQIAFIGSLIGTGVDFSNDLGLFSEGGGSGLSLVAREGDAAPGTGGGVNFSGLNTPTFSRAGQTAFRSSLTGTGVTSSNDFGIWAEDLNGNLQLVAREGDPAPGTGSGFIFSSLGNPSINGAGQTAFLSELIGPGTNSSNNSGIFSEGGGSGLSLVAREGDPAPGTGSGVNFFAISTPSINSAGQTLFRSNLIGPEVNFSNNRGIWTEDLNGNLQLVARVGDAAPGTGSGVNFSDFPNVPVLNDAGQTAFAGNLTGAGVTISNDRGIWAEDLNGNLQLIAREGDLLDVDDGPGTDLRTISSVGFRVNSGNGDGRLTGFNDLGQLAFLATFTDGSSGVFVSNLVAVPEPTSAMLALFSVSALLTLWRA